MRRGIAVALGAPLLGGLLLGGCGPRVESLDPVPRGRAATLDVTDDGKPVLRIKDGRLDGVHDRRIELPPGAHTFLLFFDPEDAPEPEGERPLGAALWLRGRGDRLHVLPSVVSPFVVPGNSDDWTVGLKAGVYDLSLQSVGFEADSDAVVLVR